MTQEEFNTLLDKYAKNQCSDKERAFVEAWFDALPDRSGQNLDISERTEKKLWENIQARTDSEKEQSNIRHFWPSRLIWKAAASVTILCAVAAVLYTTNTEQKDLPSASGIEQVIATNDNSAKTYYNTGTRPMLVTFEDGSSATLEPGSKIVANDLLTRDKREVILQGEAFFEVAHNPKKPFLVYTHSLVTKVLGTSFSINASSSKMDVLVKVKTGKVAVYPVRSITKTGDVPASFITLTPNQQIVYNEQVRTHCWG